MKNIILNIGLAGFLCISSIKSEAQPSISIQNNEIVKAKSGELKTLFLKTKGNSIQSQQKFFDAFPNSFNELISLYGYDYDSDSAAPLYNEAADHIDEFFKTSSIVNDTVFYRKILSISMGGHWDADAVNYFQQGLKEKVLADPQFVANLLNEMQDQQIKSFWYFYFDGPHPDKAISDKLKTIIEVSPHVYGLMENAMEEVHRYWEHHD